MAEGRDIISSDAAWILIRSLPPRAHLLLVPKRHVLSIAELTPFEAATIPAMLKAVSSEVDYKIEINPPMAMRVAHLHLHLLGGRLTS